MMLFSIIGSRDTEVIALDKLVKHERTNEGNYLSDFEAASAATETTVAINEAKEFFGQSFGDVVSLADDFYVDGEGNKLMRTKETDIDNQPLSYLLHAIRTGGMACKRFMEISPVLAKIIFAAGVLHDAGEDTGQEKYELLRKAFEDKLEGKDVESDFEEIFFIQEEFRSELRQVIYDDLSKSLLDFESIELAVISALVSDLTRLDRKEWGEDKLKKRAFKGGMFEETLRARHKELGEVYSLVLWTLKMEDVLDNAFSYKEGSEGYKRALLRFDQLAIMEESVEKILSGGCSMQERVMMAVEEVTSKRIRQWYNC